MPQNIEIKAGQSINWYNPTPVGESSCIDSTGKNVTYLSLNANYTMDGTESYVNISYVDFFAGIFCMFGKSITLKFI
jgi:hypothetical protein